MQRNFKCIRCGATLELYEERNLAECRYCGEIVYLEKEVAVFQPPEPEVIPERSNYDYHNQGNHNVNTSNSNAKDKSTATWLCFFLGFLGFHQFYLGNNIRGALYIIGTISVLVGAIFGKIILIIVLLDLLFFISMSERTFNKKYNKVRY